MRCIIILVISFIISCKENKTAISLPGNHVHDSVANKISSPDYTELKMRSKNIHRELQHNISILNEQRLTAFITDSLLPRWYGTEWNFYGTTETPGKGTIACGYFVTTVLRDAGINLNRIKLSQCASEEMIKKVTRKESISRFRNKPQQEFINEMLLKEPGLYIVGLDFHTGFIYHNGKELFFIHSSYAYPKKVIREKADQSGVLSASKYKIIGKINMQL